MADSQSFYPERPTPETLGGINIRVEEEEDLTIIPGQIPVLHLPSLPENTPANPRQDPCINVSVEGDETNISPKTASAE